MQRITLSNAFRIIIFLVFVSLITFSPSMKVIPRSLIVTSFHDCQRLIELVLVYLVLLYSIFINNHLTSVINNRYVHRMFYLLVVLAILSTCLAVSPRHAAIEISLFAGLSYLALYVANLYHANKALLIKWLTYSFWAGILLCMVSFYVGYFTALIFNTPVEWPRPLTGFSNIRFFNQYQLWGIGLITLPLLTFDFKSANIRRCLHIALSFWFVLLFFAASRGALLAWLFGILMTFIVYKKLAWPFIRLQIIYISVGFILYEILFKFTPALKGAAIITGSVLRDRTNDRIELWNLSLNLIQDHPYFGIGPMSYAWFSKISTHPHNSILQIMSEWGLPAALIAISLAIYGLISWLKKFNQLSLQTNSQFNCNLAIILFFTLCTCLAYSLVDGVIVMPVSQVMMFTFIGLALGFYSESVSSEINSTAITSNSIFKVVFSGLVLATLAWSTLPEILQSASGSEKHFSIGYPATGPRIWLEVK